MEGLDKFKTFFLILGFALVIRGMVLITIAPEKPTSWETELIVKNLLSGKGFTFIYTGSIPYRAYKPPLYEWLTAGVYLLTQNSQRAMILLQCLFGAVLSGIIFLIGQALLGTPAGLVAGALTALHPGLIYYDTHQLHALSLAGLLISLIAWVFIKLREKDSWAWRFLAGTLIGIAVHERGTVGVLLPVGVIWLWITHRGRGQQLWRLAWPILLGFVLVITPWTLRNAWVYHRFVFMTSMTGELFWRGNNPQATGTTVTSDLTPILCTLPADFENKMATMDELSQQEFLRRKAWGFIRSNPRQAFTLFIKKLLIFWWFAPTSGYRYPHFYLPIYKLFYLATLLFGLLGFSWGVRQADPYLHERMAFLICIAIGFSLVQSLYYVEIRHRWAIEPLLLVFAGGGISRTLALARRA